MMNNSSEIVPFLKWAGGKRWFISNHMDVFPKNYSRYIEPFLGSGAVYFALKPQHAILSDTNEWLIETYKAIRDNWEKVEGILKQHQRNHCTTYYYSVRRSNPRTAYSKAAKLIYLNRTCWNALFRVNRDGEFNVPIGTKSSVLLETDNFKAVSKCLKKARLVNEDFLKIIEIADKNDLIYADPPYIVNHANNGFVKYNEHLFTWRDQIRLRDALFNAHKRGAHIIVSNAFHKSIRNLYKDWCILKRIQRRNTIAGRNGSRGFCDEYLIIA